MGMCLFVGCSRKSCGHGLCHTHYYQKQRTGKTWEIGSRTYFPKHFAVKGKKHPAYINGSGKGHDYRTSIEAIESSGGKCQDCGSRKKLNRHHIDGNVKNDKPSNWQVLCCKCHQRRHSKYFGLSLKEKRRIQEEKARRIIKEKLLKEGVFVPPGYIKCGEASRILNRSRTTINNHASDRYHGTRLQAQRHGTTPIKRPLWVFPKEHILAIAKKYPTPSLNLKYSKYI